MVNFEKLISHVMAKVSSTLNILKGLGFTQTGRIQFLEALRKAIDEMIDQIRNEPRLV